MLAKLERAEVSRVGKALAADRGLEWKEVKIGDHVGGELLGQTRLASGRFAMLDSGLGFQLVPWSDPLEKQLGRTIGGVAIAGRRRGLGSWTEPRTPAVTMLSRAFGQRVDQFVNVAPERVGDHRDQPYTDRRAVALVPNTGAW